MALALFLEAVRTVAVTVQSFQDIETVEVFEVEHVAPAGVGGTAVAAGTAGAAEVEVVGTVEVVEACENQLLHAVAHEVAHFRVSAERFVAPVQFSGAGLLLLYAAEPLYETEHIKVRQNGFKKIKDYSC